MQPPKQTGKLLQPDPEKQSLLGNEFLEPTAVGLRNLLFGG
jgi:hypothetical protein